MVVAVAVLMVAGLHVPVTPLLDVVGNAGAALFWHNGPIAVNVGVTCGSMIMVSVAFVAHCPAAGVKMYVVGPAVAVLMVAGLHVPVTPLLEVVANAGAAEFWHSGPMGVNAGVTSGLTVMINVPCVAHCPAAGVNVYVVGPAVAVFIVAGITNHI